MANEYLQRTPTSVGNQQVWTWSGWVKRNVTGGQQNLWRIETGASNDSGFRFDANNSVQLDCLRFYLNGGIGGDVVESSKRRDVGSWMHIMMVYDSTTITSASRIQLYVNGLRVTNLSLESYPTLNYLASFNGQTSHKIGASTVYGEYSQQQLTDVFFVDGQALTPDVFGFNKPGKGYISSGSSVVTDFRGGQWVPKTPRIIKAEINRRGGFGVNGFYLPMNSSNNFGADFHCIPDTIFRLKEALPQPKAEIDGSGDYTNALRDDPFKQYLIYAQPNVLGGLQNGYGDYSHIIRGSGAPKTITGGASGTPTISTTQSLYYGSSLYFDGNDTLNVETNDSNYLGRDFTIEFWIWHDAAYPIHQMIFNTTPHPSFGISLNRGGSGQTSLYIGNGSTWQTLDFRSGGRLYSQQWNHVAIERHNNAITIYHNGVAQGTTTAVMPTGFSSLFRYGTYDNTTGESVVGYVQDYRVYSGVAKYKGGFDCPKPYTPVGIATWRAVPDSTANNFATWNPVSPGFTSNALFSNGNLTVSETTSNTAQGTGTFGPSSGKWYYEARAANVTSSSHLIGIRAAEWNNSNAQNSLSYRSNGDVYNYNSTVTSQSAYATGDIIGIAFDPTNGKLWFSKNGVWTNGDPSTGSGQNVNYTPSATTAFFAFDNVAGTQTWDANFGQNPTFSGNTTAGTYTDSNGKGLFKYQPPAGFLALCEDNLPTPAISDPGEHFKTVLWTGNDATRSITGVGFKPGLVWIKNRSSAYYHHLYDSVRGANRAIYSNGTEAEFLDTDAVLSFDDNGFSVGAEQPLNRVGDSIVAWCWKAGGPAVTNTDGSITSQVSANQDAGFSIVSWTAANPDGRNTLGHGLGKTPKFIIAKSRTSGADHWVCYHNSLGKDKYILLSSTAGEGSFSNYWSSEEPDSTTFGVVEGTSSSNNDGSMIAYCWAEIEGFSKFGSYVGNGSTDGPFVYCGFKPAFVLIKCSTAAQGWYIFDNSRKSYNDDDQRALRADSTEIEDTNWPIDFVSNGLKIRYSSATNTSGQTFIFAAFAESPFTTANAK